MNERRPPAPAARRDAEAFVAGRPFPRRTARHCGSVALRDLLGFHGRDDATFLRDAAVVLDGREPARMGAVYDEPAETAGRLARVDRMERWMETPA